MTFQDQQAGFFKVRIASGEYQGFYVGAANSGLLTPMTADEDRPLALDNFSYTLNTQERAAILFGASAALKVQRDLRDLSIDSELI
jgi:hypothetical protein